MTPCRPTSRRPLTVRSVTAALLLLCAGALGTATLAACGGEEEGRAFRAPDPSTANSETVPPPAEPDPTEDLAPSLAECTDGACTASFTAGDRLDFESGVGLEELRIDDVGGGAIEFSGTRASGNSGVICSGGCSISTRSSSSGSVVTVRAEEGANLILGDFLMRILSVDGGSATVQLGTG